MFVCNEVIISGLWWDLRLVFGDEDCFCICGDWIRILLDIWCVLNLVGIIWFFVIFNVDVLGFLILYLMRVE